MMQYQIYAEGDRWISSIQSELRLTKGDRLIVPVLRDCAPGHPPERRKIRVNDSLYDYTANEVALYCTTEES